MPEQHRYDIAIVDFGMGNLFGVEQACDYFGLQSIITSSPAAISGSSAAILPGVGAFGDAMENLTQLGLVPVIKDFATSGKPLIGICLGMQLLMTESYEFGKHYGLGIIPGDVIRLAETSSDGAKIKVPQVGWNQIRSVFPEKKSETRAPAPTRTIWQDTSLDGLEDEAFMYFNHSFYVRPSDPNVVIAVSRYGDLEFCSSFQKGNVMGFQFHPERSGPQGLHVYHNLARLVSSTKLESLNV